jgi:hypothetical protein
MSLTSIGVINEAITAYFDFLLKAASLQAPLYTLMNLEVAHCIRSTP